MKKLLLLLSTIISFTFLDITSYASDITLQTSVGTIEDGTKDFDNDNNPGHDQNNHNKIVRSFDTITYPIKIVVSSKDKQYNNVQVKIKGSIENANINGSQQATFSTGTPINNDTSSMEDTCMIEHTGSSVSVPEIVSVLGAKNGTKIKTHFSVQVVKIDGRDVTNQNLTQSFDTEDITVSSKPNIDIKIGKMHTAELMPVGDLYNIDNNRDLYGKLGITIGCKPLPEHGNSIKGSAYPTGQIKFDMKNENRVDFDNGKSIKDNDYGKCLAYGDVGDPYNDHLNVLSTATASDNIPLKYLQTCVKGTLSIIDNTPKSSDKYTKDARLERAGVTNYVKDSGQYKLTDTNTNNIHIEDNNYKIGKYKTICGYLDVPRTDNDLKTYNGFGNMKPFSSQQFIYRIPYKYGYKMSGNKDNLSNTFYSKFTITNVTSNEDGKVINYNINVSSDAKYRYTPSGNYTQSSNWAFSDGRGLEAGHQSPGIGSHHWSTGSWGDSMTYKNSDNLSAYTYLKATTPIYGLKTITKWNPDSFEMSNTDNWLYNVNIDYRKITWMFGVEKNNKHSDRDIFNKGVNDFDWYPSYESVPNKNKIAAVMHSADAKDATYGEVETRIHLRLKPTVQGNYSPQNTPNYMSSKSYGKIAPDAPEEELTKPYIMKQISLYDDNGNRTQTQSPANGNGVIFDNLYVTGSRTYVILSADRKAYNSDEPQSWKITPTYMADVQQGYHDNVKMEVQLDKGQVYKANSAYYESNNKRVEPNITFKDGYQILTWNFTIDNDHKNPEIVHFSTVSDPSNLNFDSSGTVDIRNRVTISADNDKSPISSRRSSDNVRLRKIEMIGIMHTIDKNQSELNDGYQLTIKPYTTKSKETNITGIWHIPINNYHGSIHIQKLVNKLNGKIYINKNIITTQNPNAIDITKNGWEEYTNQKLDSIKSVYYSIPELTSKDDKQLVLDIKTDNNKADDVYQSQVFGNSSSNDQVPTMSNIVTNTVHNRTISGFVWRDDNHDGKYNNEKLLSDIEMSLYCNGNHVTHNLSGKDISSIKSDKNGHYEFTDLPSGTYYVKSSKPSNMDITLKNVGTDDRINSKFADNQLTDNIVLPTLDKMNTNYTIENQNLGLYYKLGTIKVQKLDRNNNPLVGATFRLYANEHDAQADKPIHYKDNQVIFPDEHDLYDSSSPYDVTSDKDGWVIFNNIPLYRQKDYVIKEIKSPDHYALSMETTHVSVNDDNQTGIAKVINDLKYIPATGSFKLLGIVIIVTTLCIILWFVHYKQKHKKN